MPRCRAGLRLCARSLGHLGRHAIAIVQTTAIDKEFGLVPFDTVLAHAVGGMGGLGIERSKASAPQIGDILPAFTPEEGANYFRGYAQT